jgi:hypothetical protein
MDVSALPSDGGGGEIPTDISPEGDGYLPSYMAPEGIPAGFDTGDGSADFGGGGGGDMTTIPTSMPVSQTVGMPMFVQPAQGAATVPTTESYSAADLVGSTASPGDQSGLPPQPQAYQPQMMAVPSPSSQVVQPAVSAPSTSQSPLPPGGAPQVNLPPIVAAQPIPQPQAQPAPAAPGMVNLPGGGIYSATSPTESQGQILSELVGGNGGMDVMS